MLEELPITKQTIQNPIRRFNVGSGMDAIHNTLKLMRTVIIKSSYDYYTRRWAENIIANTPKDPIQRINAIYDYLKQHTKYVKDPDGFEYIKVPKVSLQLLETNDIPIMDCDDYTVLSLALLKSVGFHVGMRATGYTSTKIPSHVYGLVQPTANSNWYALDLTQGNGLDWEAPNPTVTVDMEVM